MKHSNDPIRNRTCSLPACSVVLQSTAPPCTPFHQRDSTYTLTYTASHPGHSHLHRNCLCLSRVPERYQITQNCNLRAVRPTVKDAGAFTIITVNQNPNFWRAYFGTWLGWQCSCVGRTGVYTACPIINNDALLWTPHHCKTWRYFDVINNVRYSRFTLRPGASKEVRLNFVVLQHKKCNSPQISSLPTYINTHFTMSVL